MKKRSEKICVKEKSVTDGKIRAFTLQQELPLRYTCGCYHIRCDLRLTKALSGYELYQHRQYHKLDRKILYGYRRIFQPCVFGQCRRAFQRLFFIGQLPYQQQYRGECAPQSANEPVLKVRSTYETGMYLCRRHRRWISRVKAGWSIKKKVGKDELYSGEYNISDSFSPEKIAQAEQYMRLFGGLTQKKTAYVCGLFLYLRALGITGLCGNTSCYGGKRLQ